MVETLGKSNMGTTIRILVCGGRDYLNYTKLSNTLDTLTHEFHPENITIIQGGAKGADFLAKVYCHCYSRGELFCEEYPADWKQFGKSAGSIRNQQMLDSGRPDLVVACKGGYGTADMVKRAKVLGLKVVEVT